MSSAPYFKLYFSDLAGDTLHLTTEQIGAYVLLLGAMWNAGGKLPNDPAMLARIARVSPKRWAKVWPGLMPFFEFDHEVTHRRMTADRQKWDQISQDRKNISALGNAAKRLKVIK